jgi:iron complex outermembrane receptor protein
LSYGASGAGGGDLLIGAQVDRMRLRDSNLPVQEGGQWTRFGDSRAAPLIQPGREVIYSGFSQLRHKFNDRWIANVGVRLDIKDRHRGENVTDLSPRAALVWVPSSRFDLKLSYGRSFVDAPYWYRYNIFPAYQGSADLKPEHLSSLQLTPSLSLMDGKLRNTLNVFYNDVSDFVFRNNAAGPNDARYANAGSLKSLGFEHETAWTGANLRVNAALTFQTVLDSKAYDARGNQTFNVPRFVGNLVVDANPLGQRSDRAWVNLNLRYTGSQLAPIASTFRLGADGLVAPFRDPNNSLDGYLLANLGVRIERVVVPGASLGLTVYNLFDERYSQGGSTLFPYPQAGRSLVLNLTYAAGRH